jgi:O-antigen/teichoic acid export membrane protein
MRWPLNISDPIQPLMHLLESICFPRELLGASAYSMLGSGVLRLAQVCGTVLLARMLNPSDLGQVSLVQSTLVLFVSLGTLGGGVMGTRLVAQRSSAGAGGTALGSAIILSIALSAAGSMVASVVVALNAARICRMAFHGADLVPMLQIGCLYVLFTALNDALMGVLRGFRDFRTIAVNQALQGVALICAYAALVPKWIGKGAIAGLALSGVVGVVTALPAIRRRWRTSSAALQWKSVWSDLHIVGHVGLPVMLTALLGAPAIWLMSTTLARSSSGYPAIALLNVSNAVRLMLLFVPMLLTQAVFPFAMAAKSDDPARYDRYLRFLHHFVALPLHALSLIMIFFAAPLMSVFGKSYQNGSVTLALILLAVAVQGFGSTSAIALQCSHRLWMGLLLNVIWGAVLVCTTKVFASSIGASAGALGYVLGYAVLVAGQTWLVRTSLPDGILRMTMLGVLLNFAVASTWLAVGAGTAVGRSVALIALAATYFLRLPAVPSERQRQPLAPVDVGSIAVQWEGAKP